jgi:hypothetical protein
MWRFLKKLKTEPSYDPAIPLLWIFLNECKPGYNSELFQSGFPYYSLLEESRVLETCDFG